MLHFPKFVTTLGERGSHMQNEADKPPCPTCNQPGTFQQTDGSRNWYLCPNGHQFYRRINQ